MIATGRISAYGDRSEYQVVVERLEYAGEGALLARIELLRKKLAAEGLFDAALKKPIPLLPALIGVITSPKGAVLHDIMTTIARRFPRPILLWPVAVQGEGAAQQIATAIAGMDRLPAPGIPRPDVLIVARGGGSLEDLMAFNEEIVLRAAAACRLPLISAVGHETDTTLIDFVSDRRAPTPTAAAEMAVPPRAELLADLAQKNARLLGALARITGERRLRLNTAGARLPDLPTLLGNARIRLDDRAQRLTLALPNLLAARRTALVAAERHIPDPRTLLAAHAAALRLLAQRHHSALLHLLQQRRTQAAALLPRLSPAPLAARLREQRARLEGLSARLEGASYQSVLARGFVLVRDSAGKPITRAALVPAGGKLTLRFADGEAHAIAAGRQGSLPL